MTVSFLCSMVLLVLLNRSTEALFFRYPKRAIMSFLESLGGQKEMKPPIHHYHMHYYPVPLVLPKPAPPPKIEIDLSSRYSGHNHFRSLSWTSQDLNKLHEPEITVISSNGNPEPSPPWVSSLSESNGWPDPYQQKSSWAWDNNELLEKDQVYSEAKPSGILLQVPLRQQIVLYQPPSAKDNKSSLLTVLLKKLRRLNDALFHLEHEDNAHKQHHDDRPLVANSLTYATAQASCVISSIGDIGAAFVVTRIIPQGKVLAILKVEESNVAKIVRGQSGSRLVSYNQEFVVIYK
ncbi:uncharacterized protein LOC106646741 [Copidosoma floridanum]|uniref:uncharacterized protein LOC106646741 n=1 Tax=Copidosoma floridanum TaxID=29053 RepID=UPI0006C9716A|nr:uncharacterized protein LOC106646741 [Copidosoma floridanum]